MNVYVMKFKGAILVRAESKEEAEDLFNDAHYGLATTFDNTDEMSLYAFQYDYCSMQEVYE